VSPSLTVIVPTRSRADFLGPTLASILAAAAEAERARGTRTVVLVVDDASDDGGATRAVAERYGVRYHRIGEHDGRRDPGVAIVTGVQMVETSHHMLFGDDDAMTPSLITSALAHVDEGADVVSMSYWWTGPDLTPTREVILPPGNLGDLVRGHVIVNDGAITRTDLVRDLPWDPSLAKVMLLPHWVQLAVDGRRFATPSVPPWYYRRHEANISSSPSDEDREVRERLLADLQAMVVQRLGYLPTGPYHEAREERIARRVAKDAAKAAAALAPPRREPLTRRVRRRLARAIAP
jgi:glycosyltransferase involved in cell wall biosynthesis